MLINHRAIDRLMWKAKRLSCMSTPEIVYRITVFIKNNLEMLGFFRIRHLPIPDLKKEIVKWFGNVENVDSNSYSQAADKISQGYLDIFELTNHHIGEQPKWNSDPLTGINAPLAFGKTLDYRNDQLVGDIKYVWEPNRHLQLVTLAQAYYLTNSDNYLECIKHQLSSWFDQCPYLMGPNWVSSLELGIRLINWYLVWQLVNGLESNLFKGKKGKEFRDRWLLSIYQHVYFINNHYSKYSSANNHLIGEATGVFIATIGWPYWEKFNIWNKKAADILEHEALLQNYMDGVNREQAIAYQQFVLDFLLLAILTANANKIQFSEGLMSRVESMLEFLASIMDSAGNLPMIGDADDGYVVKLCHGDSEWCAYRSLLATGAVLFNRSDFATKSQYFDAKSRWLLGGQGLNKYNSLSVNTIKLPIKRSFKHGGYYILGDEYESKHEVKLIADVGPLGYLNIAAHGHADALSFTLFVGGKEILIDPGTYAYHTQKKWRNYFRGTSAHNTIRVDGKNQSVIGGNFMWLRKANVTCNSWIIGEHEDLLSASHDGYARLSDPVNHERTICYNKRHRKITVIDSIMCKSKHEVEIFWHFCEKCKVVEHSSNEVMIHNGDVILKLEAKEQLDENLEIVSGSYNPPLGWVSRRFSVKQPTSTVVLANTINGDTKFYTEITIMFTDTSTHGMDDFIGIN